MDLIEAPDWLLQVCAKPLPKNNNGAAHDDDLITKNRNSTLTAIAGSLRRNGMVSDELVATLKSINDRRCHPPLPEREVITIAESVGKYKIEINVQSPDPEDPGLGSVSWQSLGLPLNRQNVPIINVDCAVRVLQGLPTLQIWFDEFHKRYFTKKDGVVREWADIDDLNLTVFMQKTLGLTRMSDDMVAKAVRVYAQLNIRNEPRDWMDTLDWDGTPRLPHFFENAFGVDHSAYSHQAGVNFFVSMAARIYRPGCKVDTMIVLEGAQGIGKTMALHAIGGDWHTESTEPITSKDFFQCLHGKLIVEIAELDGFSKAEVTRVKQVISCRTDRYRASYGRHAADHPRMCVLVGTTNQQAYLRDETGGRRFWPIHCMKIDLGYIKENRDQLFAEAVALFKQGENWYHMPHAETIEQQESRRQVDDWEDVIRRYLEIKTQVTSLEVATECLKIEVGRNDRMVQMRVAKVLRTLNWKTEQIRRGRDRVRVWVSC